MNNDELEAMIFDQYAVTGESLWPSSPMHRVFRHPLSRKWFALVLDIPAGKLDAARQGVIRAAVVKCGELLLPAYLGRPGFYPAYYMNKASWVSVSIADVPAGELLTLLDMSYGFAAAALKQRRPKR